jgi:hypothetical protein
MDRVAKVILAVAVTVVLALLILLGIYIFWAGQQDTKIDHCHSVGGVAVQEYGSGDAICVKAVK